MLRFESEQASGTSESSELEKKRKGTVDIGSRQRRLRVYEESQRKNKTLNHFLFHLEMFTPLILWFLIKIKKNSIVMLLKVTVKNKSFANECCKGCLMCIPGKN